MQIQFAAKKIGDVFEGALIVNGHFARSLHSKKIGDLFDRLVGPLLEVDRGEGMSVTADIAILTEAEAAGAGSAPQAKQ